MSEEILRIDTLRAHAEHAARHGYSVDACPYKDDPRRAEMWTTFYFVEVERRYLGAIAA